MRNATETGLITLSSVSFHYIQKDKTYLLQRFLIFARYISFFTGIANEEDKMRFSLIVSGTCFQTGTVNKKHLL